MERNKNLVLLSDNYPNTDGEFFLDDEINVIANYFQKITVICMSSDNGKKRSTPKNLEVISIPKIKNYHRLFYRILGVFYLPLWKEFFSSKRHYNIKPSWIIFKILLEDYVRSSFIIRIINQNFVLDPEKLILYSYWQDYKALAIARIRKKTGCMAISRCHRWDVYFYANNPEFLPYRRFILKELSCTYSISIDGINYLTKKHELKNNKNIKLSRLGKTNNFLPNLEKSELNKDCITICSCSTLTPVKRVNLIIEFVQKISLFKNIRWVHFGDGFLKDQITNEALSMFSNKVDYYFAGIKPNAEILSYFNDNYIDLFVNFSSSEGIPVSIMEAQSAGIPVLATNVGGTSEIVDNENGFLVEKDFEMDEVVQKIILFLNSSPDEIHFKRKAAYSNWDNNYNSEKNYTHFIESIFKS